MPDPQREAIQIFLLGRFEIAWGERHLKAADWKRRKAARLLQRMALERRLLKEEAIDFLWPDSGLDSGSNNLYRTLYALRKVLNDAFGPESDAAIFSFVNGVLFLDEAVWVDAAAFEALAGSATWEWKGTNVSGKRARACPCKRWLPNWRKRLPTETCAETVLLVVDGRVDV